MTRFFFLTLCALVALSGGASAQLVSSSNSSASVGAAPSVYFARIFPGYVCSPEVGLLTRNGNSILTNLAIKRGLDRSIARELFHRRPLTKLRFLKTLQQLQRSCAERLPRDNQGVNGGRARPGLIAEYLFNEGIGANARDSSGYSAGLPLTLNPLVTWNVPAPGINFASSGGVARTPSAAGTISSQLALWDRMTFESWVAPRTVAGNIERRILAISKGNTTANGDFRVIQIGRNLRIHLRMDSLTRSYDIPGVFVQADTPVHLVITYDGIFLAVYVNGQPTREVLRAGSQLSFRNRLPLAFGNEPSLTKTFLGRIFLGAVYNRALSPTEVAQNYLAGYQVTSSSSDPSPSSTPSSSPSSSSGIAISSGGSASSSSVSTSASSSSSVTSSSAASSSSVAINLLPGSRFTEPTPQPTPVGDPQQNGYDAKTMAAWDVVPYDVVEGELNVGVLAYHINDIRHVRFSADNGPWVQATQKLVNPQTNAEEFFVRFRASDFPDGPVEIRAIAEPTTGIPRLLPSLMLYANFHHSLARPTAYVSPAGSDTTGDGSEARPFASLVKAAMSFSNPNGATVYMKPGDYWFGHTQWWEGVDNRLAYITFTPAPGVSRGQVRITSGSDSGIGTTLVHLKNITLLPSAIIGINARADVNTLWIEGCRLTGTTASTGYAYSPWSMNYQTYTTESEVSGQDGGPQGVLVRNLYAHDMYSQGITGVVTAVNVLIENIDRGIYTEMHPDVDHFYGMERLQEELGIIRYNVIATQHIVARGAAGPGLNVVYDKCQFSSVYPLFAISMGGTLNPSGTEKTTQNVLFYDTQAAGGVTWNESPTPLNIVTRNVLFQNSRFNGLPSPPGTPSSGTIVR